MSKKIIAVNNYGSPLLGATVVWVIQNDIELLNKMRESVPNRIEILFKKNVFIHNKNVCNILDSGNSDNRKIPYIGIAPIYNRVKLYSNYCNSTAIERIFGFNCIHDTGFKVFIDNKPIPLLCLSCDRNMICIEQSIHVFSRACKYSIVDYNCNFISGLKKGDRGSKNPEGNTNSQDNIYWRDKASIAGLIAERLSEESENIDIDKVIADYMGYDLNKILEMTPATIIGGNL